MEINKTCQHPAFTANFVRNDAFEGIVNYAQKTGKLHVLDTALNKLKNANEGDVLVVHGGNAKEELFSNFTVGRKSASVQRSNYDAESKEELSFFGILDLAKLENSNLFKMLFGKKVKNNVSAQDIFDRYTV